MEDETGATGTSELNDCSSIIKEGIISTEEPTSNLQSKVENAFTDVQECDECKE